MNTSLFIAKRLYNAKENNNSYTRPIIRIAILAVALSVSIMLLSVFFQVLKQRSAIKFLVLVVI